MKRMVLPASLLLNVLLIAVLGFLIYRLGGVRYVMFKAQNNGVAGVYQHRKNLFEVLPTTEEGKEIIFLGNSITAQGEWAEMFGLSNIRNRGIPGDMTDGMLRRLPYVTYRMPEKIFLMIGVNDLIFRSPQDIVYNYKEILDKIEAQTPDTEIIIQSLLPVNPEVKAIPIKNSDILEINTAIEEESKKRGITFVNIHTLLADKDGNLDARYTVDGIHINGKAYLIWKDAIEKLVHE